VAVVPDGVRQVHSLPRMAFLSTGGTGGDGLIRSIPFRTQAFLSVVGASGGRVSGPFLAGHGSSFAGDHATVTIVLDVLVGRVSRAVFIVADDVIGKGALNGDVRKWSIALNRMVH
jgi:hypothetical protein